jgi:hypothetical protein
MSNSSSMGSFEIPDCVLTSPFDVWTRGGWRTESGSCCWLESRSPEVQSVAFISKLRVDLPIIFAAIYWENGGQSRKGRVAETKEAECLMTPTTRKGVITEDLCAKYLHKQSVLHDPRQLLTPTAELF